MACPTTALTMDASDAVMDSMALTKAVVRRAERKSDRSALSMTSGRRQSRLTLIHLMKKTVYLQVI